MVFEQISLLVDEAFGRIFRLRLLLVLAFGGLCASLILRTLNWSGFDKTRLNRVIGMSTYLGSPETSHALVIAEVDAVDLPGLLFYFALLAAAGYASSELIIALLVIWLTELFHITLLSVAFGALSLALDQSYFILIK